MVSDNFNSHLLAITCVARSLVTACKTLRSHFYSFIADTEVLLNGFSVLTTIDWYRFVVQPATHSYLGLLVPSKGTDLNTLISTCYQNCKISLHLEKTKNPPFGRVWVSAYKAVWKAGWAWAFLCDVVIGYLVAQLADACPVKTAC